MFDKAISISPRSRDCRFSSVTSAGRPPKSGDSVCITAARPGSIGSSSSRQPSSPATAAASSRLGAEVNSDGSITQRTFSAPSASTATAATSALSTPPESPSSAFENPVLRM